MTVPADLSAPRPGKCYACGHEWPSTRPVGSGFERCPSCGSDEVVVGPHPPVAVTDTFDRADGDLGQGDGWLPTPGVWGISSSKWRGKPTMIYSGQEGVTLNLPPVSPYPPYPRRDGRPLRGWARLRFRLALLSYGHSVRSVQQTGRRLVDDGILVDGVPGPQTWSAFYMLIWRGRR